MLRGTSIRNPTMTPQDLFLGMVLAAFATFAMTLGAVSIWSNRSPSSSDKA